MAKKKQEQQDEGAPAWMLTYGDMVTQLLAFFIMLFAASTIQQTRWSAMIGSLKASLGVLPRQLSAVSPLRLPVPKARRAPREGNIGIEGPNITVTQVEQGRKITVASKVLFEEGRAELLAESRQPLLEAADMFRGTLNRLEVRGHAARNENLAGGRYADTMALSLARGRAVRDFLVEQGRLPETRIFVVGCSYYRPVASDLFDEERWGNWRGEIVETTELTQP